MAKCSGCSLPLGRDRHLTQACLPRQPSTPIAAELAVSKVRCRPLWVFVPSVCSVPSPITRYKDKQLLLVMQTFQRLFRSCKGTVQSP